LAHQSDTIMWRVKGRVEKWSDEQLAAHGLIGAPSSAIRAVGLVPEVEEFEGNLLLNAGINVVWDALIGDTYTAFSNANARIGVGDTNTAAAATQTDLQAPTNKAYVAMNGGYPSVTNQTVTFQADFGSGVGNFAWEEWIVDNGTTALNRKVTSLGTKSGGTWTLTVDITLS
jgi:hypothetical protein